MTPLPPPLGSGEIVFWRIDRAKYATTWDSGEGSYLAGGRWSSRGIRAVYAAVDPATAILEVAVHTTFPVLDTVPHVLTSARIPDFHNVHVTIDFPNRNWLKPGTPSAGQQAFGDALLRDHLFVFIPSTVSVHSWNVFFDPKRAAGLYDVVLQEPFALDGRLHPPPAFTVGS